MKRLIQFFRAKLARLTSPEPARRQMDGAPFDWLPPSLGTSELCSSLLAGAIDHGTAWYFDRPERLRRGIVGSSFD